MIEPTVKPSVILRDGACPEPVTIPARKPKFIVCAPRYSETVGGSIALHKLVKVLQTLGYEALLWPEHRVNLHAMPFSTAWWRRYSYIATRLYRPRYSTIPGSKLRFARESDIEDSIVIYPDIIDNNPLEAQRYVRWFLYHVDTQPTKFAFSPGDLYFCFQEAFNHNYSRMEYGGVLQISHLLLDIYKQTNFGVRTGVCYMVRKGKSRSDLPSLRGELVLDGMSHRAMAAVFNQKKYCYFYDTYTAYSVYAAACGCIPVVVPIPGIERDTWQPSGEGLPGIAYGESDIPHAMETRHLLIQSFADTENKNIESARNFVAVVSNHFKL